MKPARGARWLLVALGLWGAPAAQAAPWLLAAPHTQVVAGEVFSVVLVAAQAPADWPQRLPARVELPGAAASIALELVAAEEGADAGGDAGATQRRYVGRWPGEVVGVASLRLEDSPQARLLLDAGAAARSPVETAQLQARSVAAATALVPAPANAAAVAPNPLDFHEPMYFLVGGTDPVTARFQFSFRYRLFDDHGVVAESLPMVRGLYFGFTQTSLWDLSAASKPFRDSSFRPALFYQWRLRDPLSGGSLSLSGGYEHESNGRGGEDSRSIDTLFLRAEARHYLADGRTYLGIAPKLWAYLDKEDNPDIARYRGHAQLNLRLGRDDGLMLSSLYRRGTAGKSSVQWDLSYPLRRSIFSGVGAFLHLQYFKGYGETILDYQDASRHPQYRIGFSIVR